MPFFRKKPVTIEATQWFKLGDHPKVNNFSFNGDFKNCNYCQEPMLVHGYITTLEGGHIVCPGDWIITGVEGEHYPCKQNIFEKTYEKAE